jgi:hypothetical protein
MNEVKVQQVVRIERKLGRLVSGRGPLAQEKFSKFTFSYLSGDQPMLKVMTGQ